MKIEREILEKLYVKEGKKQKEIAITLNSTQSVVSYFCKKYKLKKIKTDKTIINYRRHWSQEDIEQLEELHGTCTYKTIAKILGRTVKAVETKKNRLGLGEATKATEFLNASELAAALNRSQSSVMRWINFKGLPHIKKKLAHERKFYRIDVKEFWKWAYNNDLMAWERYEINSLANEPSWLLEEKKKTNQKSKNVRIRWNETDTMLLTNYYKIGMSLKDIAKKLNRTMHSVDSRLVMLGVKRNIVHIPWHEREIDILMDGRAKGITFREISEELGREITVVQKKYRILMLEQNKSLTY